MDKTDTFLLTLLILGLIAYPLFLKFGFDVLVSLGWSIAAVVLGIAYLIVAIIGGACWLILIGIVLTIIFD